MNWGGVKLSIAVNPKVAVRLFVTSGGDSTMTVLGGLRSCATW
jgi:hypothetical protein